MIYEPNWLMLIGCFFKEFIFLSNEVLPKINFYDQDFIDLYDRSWVRILDNRKEGSQTNKFEGVYLGCEGQTTFNLYENCLSSLFLNYSNQTFSPFPMIDYFYSRQEEDGAIRCDYSLENGLPVLTEENPEGICIPLLAYVEFFFYHKIANKKRLKEIVPKLEKYFDWIKATFRQENGLFSVPLEALDLGNLPRDDVFYPVDFNAQLAMNALYMSYIGDILNDKELSFRFKRMYFALKTRINNLMWDSEKKFYFDLDKAENKLDLKHIGCFWTMLAEIPNDERAASLIKYLKDPEFFGTDNPFPCVSADSVCYNEKGNGHTGSVIPAFTYMVIKGLEKYGEAVFARECAIRTLYFVIDTLSPEEDKNGDVWGAYLSDKEGIPHWVKGEKEGFPVKKDLSQVCLLSITLMIENIIGFEISLPRKTVYWTVPSLEVMGIENLSLKRNFITILSNKNVRGWEIRLESEKLYYFTIEILDEKKKKTLPIPSGKCSMLIDKL